MLVCVVDMLFPPKHRHTQVKPPKSPPKSPASESEGATVDSEEEAKSSKEEHSSEQVASSVSLLWNTLASYLGESGFRSQGACFDFFMVFQAFAGAVP